MTWRLLQSVEKQEKVIKARAFNQQGGFHKLKDTFKMIPTGAGRLGGGRRGWRRGKVRKTAMCFKACFILGYCLYCKTSWCAV